MLIAPCMEYLASGAGHTWDTAINIGYLAPMIINLNKAFIMGYSSDVWRIRTRSDNANMWCWGVTDYFFTSNLFGVVCRNDN